MKYKTALMALLMAMLLLPHAQAETTIPMWREDSPCAAEISRLLERIDTEGSPDHVPVGERIAVFDFDGTLFGERFPTYFDHLLLMRRDAA